MSLIENVGQGFQGAADHLDDAAHTLNAGRINMAEAQGMLLGVAEESSEDSQLVEAIAQYGRALDEATAAVEYVAGISQHIGTMGLRLGYEIISFDAMPPPEVYVTHVPPPTPREGDPGNTTPEQFQYYVDLEARINQQLDDGVSPENILGFIDEGSFCYVFRTLDGKVIKIPGVGQGLDTSDRSKLPRPGIMWHSYATALKQGQGTKDLEQFVAYIDDRGVSGRGAVVCEFVAGKTLANLTDHERQHIPAGHLQQLMRIFQTLESRDLMNDPSFKNIVYDPKQGFTIIDYFTVEMWNKTYGSLNVSPKASDMAAAFIRDYVNINWHYTQTQRYVEAFQQTFGKAAAKKLKRTLL